MSELGLVVLSSNVVVVLFQTSYPCRAWYPTGVIMGGVIEEFGGVRTKVGSWEGGEGCVKFGQVHMLLTVSVGQVLLYVNCTVVVRCYVLESFTVYGRLRKIPRIQSIIQKPRPTYYALGGYCSLLGRHQLSQPSLMPVSHGSRVTGCPVVAVEHLYACLKTRPPRHLAPVSCLVSKVKVRAVPTGDLPIRYY